MILSILVPALQRRPWQRIVSELQRQADEVGDVEVIVEADNGKLTSGQKRNTLMRRATGKYICHVDDDDDVDEDYVRLIVDGCRKDVDVVTFNLGMTYKRYEVWRFGLWESSRQNGRMMVNHLCAWKAEIARKVAFCDQLGYADDQIWFLPLFYSGFVKTEHHIDKVLYHYLFDRNETVNQRPERRQHGIQYARNGLRCFRRGEELFVEVPSVSSNSMNAIVRDRNNVERFMCDQRPYHTIRIN